MDFDLRRAGRAAAQGIAVEATHHTTAADLDVDFGWQQDALAAHDRDRVDLNFSRGEVGVAQIQHPAAAKGECGQLLRHIPPAAALEPA